MAQILSEQELIKRLNIFLSEYGDLYSETAFGYIIEHFFECINRPTTADILMQIYETIGCAPKTGTFYNAHLEKINNLFGLDCNIVDVGGGRIPAFANKVAAAQQKTKKGTITVYDPLLLKPVSNNPRLTLIKEEFTTDTDISKSDLVMGLLPCEATKAIITSACFHQKNFYVAMCGCSHFEEYDPFYVLGPKPYQNYVIELTKDLLEEYDNGELVIDYLPDEYDVDYPILYNRKK